jgi:hypothetical protein
MDIFQITITAIHEIYAVTVFIKGIVDDVKSYHADKLDIQTRLAHKFLFFDHFKDMFFDNGRGQAFYSKRPVAFQGDCKNILSNLQEILGEYKAKATKYGLLDVLDEDELVGSQLPSGTTWVSQYKDKMKYRLSQLGDLKKKAVNWSIFDKARIYKMLDAVREWTASSGRQYLGC